MEINARRWEARRQGRIDFPAGNRIDPDALFADEPVDVLIAERLAGVQGRTGRSKMLFDRIFIGAKVIAQPVLVDQIERRAVFMRERDRVASRKT